MDIVRVGLTSASLDTGFYAHHKNPPFGTAMRKKLIRTLPIIMTEINNRLLFVFI
jgi:hypothetical protein